MPSTPLTSEMRQVWQQLFAAAEKIYALKPWEKIDTNQIFCIRTSPDLEGAFINVLGHYGTEFGVNMYKGVSAFEEYQEFLDIIEFAPEGEITADDFFDVQDCVSLSYDAREVLQDSNYELLQEFGVKHEKDRLPHYFDCTPGYIPWRLDDDQARWTLAVLSRAIEVFEEAIKGKIEIPEYESEEDEQWLMVTSLEKNGWVNKMVKWEDYEEPNPVYDIIQAYAPRIKARAAQMSRNDRENIIAPIRMQDPSVDPDNPEGRPFFSSILHVLEAENLIIKNYLITRSPFIHRNGPENVLALLNNMDSLPQRFLTDDEEVYHALINFKDQLGCDIVFDDELPLDDFYDAMLDELDQQNFRDDS